jgi:DNA-binding winged helix-turn-helix (wHTH) protein
MILALQASRVRRLSSDGARGSMHFPASTMRDEVSSEGGVRFDAYQVDLHTGEVRKHGLKVRLPPRPFQILALLLERPGELLTRKELQERLWPADTFVDFEHGVNAAIQTLRRALCDSHKKPRFIETLPRRGYRFIAAVEKIQPHAGGTTLASALQQKEPAAVSPHPEWVGQIATICDEAGRNYVLLPISEEIFGEMCACETAKDDLGISLLVAAEKLLLVNCGTRVQILDASDTDRGCMVRIMGGQFVGEKAFAPRAYLSGLS